MTDAELLDKMMERNRQALAREHEANRQALFRERFQRKQHCAPDATFDVIPGAHPLVVLRDPAVKLLVVPSGEYGA